MRTRWRVVLAVLLGLALTGCASGSGSGIRSGLTNKTMTSNTPPVMSTGPTAPADVAAATAAVKQLYTEFFSAPTSQAKQLLQDGPSLGKAFAIANRAKGTATESAQVSQVTFDNPTTANVTFDLSANGNVLLRNQGGQAVLIGGQWKVAKATFCTLVGYSQPGTPVPGC